MTNLRNARRIERQRKALVNKVATVVVCVLAVPAFGMLFLAAGAVLSIQ